MRPRPTGVTLVAIYEFASAAFLLLGSCVVLFFAMPAVAFTTQPDRGPGGVIATLIVLLLTMGGTLVIGVASAVVGWGLLQLAPWARTGAIVLAIPALLGFPAWTVAAIIVIVYLVSDEARAAFGVASSSPWPPAAPQPPQPPLVPTAPETGPGAAPVEPPEGSGPEPVSGPTTTLPPADIPPEAADLAEPSAAEPPPSAEAPPADETREIPPESRRPG